MKQRNPYTSARGFVKVPKAPKVKVAGRHRTAHVLSPKQFQQTGAGFRTITRLGSSRIITSRKGATITQAGAGYRFGAGGRITHRQNIGSTKRSG